MLFEKRQIQFYIYDILEMLQEFDEYVKGRPDYEPVPIKQAHSFTVAYKRLAIHHLASGPYSSFLNTLGDMESCVPEDAHVFLVPCAIKLPTGHDVADYTDILTEFVSRLKFFSEKPTKHVFFTVGDNFDVFDVLKSSICFQASAQKGSPARCMHYSSPIDRSNIRSITEAEHDISFQGCGNLHPVREAVLQNLERLQGEGFDCFSLTTPRYFEELSLEERDNMQRRWVETLNSSKFILCPRGRGLSTIRTFEALSFGRIPVVYADDTKLPLHHTLDYSRLMVRVPENQIEETGRYIKEFLSANDLAESSAYARDTWLKYFADDQFESFLRTALFEGPV